MRLDESLTKGITMMWKVDFPKMIACCNCAKGGVDEYSRVLKNREPTFRKLNGHAFFVSLNDVGSM